MSREVAVATPGQAPAGSGLLQGPEFEVLLPGQTGLTYDFQEGAKGLAGAIDWLLRDPQMAHRMGQAAFHRTRAEFGIPNMVEGFLTALAYARGVPLAELSARCQGR